MLRLSRLYHTRELLLLLLAHHHHAAVAAGQHAGLARPAQRAGHHRLGQAGAGAGRGKGVLGQFERLLDLVNFLLGKILITYCMVDVIVSQVNSIKDLGKDWVSQKITKFTGTKLLTGPKGANQWGV